MKNIVIIYAITQLITTAYGLAVIESTKPFVDAKLREQGYHKNKNSLYKFNNTTSDILKGFIPFYYLIKALKISMRKGDISKEVQDQIDNKNYITEEDEYKMNTADVQVIEEVKTDDLVNNMKIAFEKPEKYTARKNDISLYDTYETPIEYMTRESNESDNLELTPFVNQDKVVEQVVVKDEVTSKDIAKAISELDTYELTLLRERIEALEKMNKNKELKLEKEVA